MEKHPGGRQGYSSELLGHLHISQYLERALVGHVLELLGAHLVLHALGLLHELRGELPYLLGAQVPSQVVPWSRGHCGQGLSCTGCGGFMVGGYALAASPSN